MSGLTEAAAKAIAASLVAAVQADPLLADDAKDYANEALDLWSEDGGYHAHNWPTAVTATLRGHIHDEDDAAKVAAFLL